MNMNYAEWGNIHQTGMTEVGESETFLRLNDSIGHRANYFCAAAEFIASAGDVTIGSSDCTACVDATHLRSAPRTAHPLAPNALKIYQHSSSCIVPVLLLAIRRGEKASNLSSPLSMTRLCW